MRNWSITGVFFQDEAISARPGLSAGARFEYRQQWTDWAVDTTLYISQTLSSILSPQDTTSARRTNVRNNITLTLAYTLAE